MEVEDDGVLVGQGLNLAARLLGQEVPGSDARAPARVFKYNVRYFKIKKYSNMQ